MKLLIGIVSMMLSAHLVSAQANTGLGTTTPTERLDVASGNVRIRDINANIGVGGTDRIVVADATGVLKTINQGAYSLFHARLAADQAVAATTITPFIFSAPLATSPLYAYNATTGVFTFNQPGNYLITVQASFGNAPAGTQLILGIRPVPDANYLARGSHYNATATSAAIGELMQYTTMLVIPSAGYQVRFTGTSNQSTTILSSETGGTGSGNVTNVTVQKI